MQWVLATVHRKCSRGDIYVSHEKVKITEDFIDILQILAPWINITIKFILQTVIVEVIVCCIWIANLPFPSFIVDRGSRKQQSHPAD